MALPLPTEIHELTERWLTAALRAGGALPTGRVASLQSTRFAEGLGLLGQLFRLTVEYEGAALQTPKQLVAKIPAASPTNRERAIAFHFYERELNFYRHLPSWAELPIPRLYYGSITPNGRQFVLLLEDLQAYTLGDQILGADASQVFAVVELAASTHARFWGKLGETAPDWLIDPRVPFHAGLVHSMYSAALPVTLRTFGSRFTPPVRRAAERLLDRIFTFWNEMMAAPTTLVHGDLRLDNLAFGSAAHRHPVMMMDFQITSSGRGPFDLAYFMSQSVPSAVRRQVEQEALERYHSSLLEKGVRNYTFDTLMQDYRRSILYCLVYPVIVGSLFDPKDDGAQAFGNIFLERALTAIEDTGATASLP